jgi:OOP family OmpA-OmpF porin
MGDAGTYYRNISRTDLQGRVPDGGPQTTAHICSDQKCKKRCHFCQFTEPGDVAILVSVEHQERSSVMHKKTLVVSLGVFFLAAASAFASVKGMIITRTGDTLTVKTADSNVTVVLTDDTKTKDDRGLFGLDERQSSAVLIPGLKVDIDGDTDGQGQVVAKTITVDGDDLEAAEMIQSGLHPTAQQVAANVVKLEEHSGNLAAHGSQLGSHDQQLQGHDQNLATHQQKIQQNLSEIQEHSARFAALTDFDVKGEAKVNFGVGSTNISQEDQDELKNLAQSANGLKGYLVEVMGYADATGNAQMNTKLSEERAKAVITYLIQQGGVGIRHIVAPGAMGEYGAAAPNETKAGRAENRRVEVKLLINKGLTASN